MSPDERVAFTRFMADQIILQLNAMLLLDHEAVEALVEHRVHCNKALSEHPTTQVAGENIGMLGILNGVVGTIPTGPRKGWGFITAVFDDDGKLIRFIRTEENP
jgi:hypothetical protein